MARSSKQPRGFSEADVTAAVRDAIFGNTKARELFGDKLRVKHAFGLSNWEGFAHPHPDVAAPPTAILAIFRVRGDKASGDASASLTITDRICINELQVSLDTSDEILWVVSRLTKAERERILQEVREMDRELDSECLGPGDRYNPHEG